MLDRLVALLGRHRTPIMQVVARSNPALPKRIWIAFRLFGGHSLKSGWRISNEEKCDQCKAVTPTTKRWKQPTRLGSSQERLGSTAARARILAVIASTDTVRWQFRRKYDALHLTSRKPSECSGR